MLEQPGIEGISPHGTSETFGPSWLASAVGATPDIAPAAGQVSG
jgi:hypothetical protein